MAVSSSVSFSCWALPSSIVNSNFSFVDVIFAKEVCNVSFSLRSITNCPFISSISSFNPSFSALLSAFSALLLATAPVNTSICFVISSIVLTCVKFFTADASNFDSNSCLRTLNDVISSFNEILILSHTFSRLISNDWEWHSSRAVLSSLVRVVICVSFSCNDVLISVIRSSNTNALVFDSSNLLCISSISFFSPTTSVVNVCLLSLRRKFILCTSFTSSTLICN